MRPKLTGWLLLLPSFTLLAFIVAAPLVWIVLASFTKFLAMVPVEYIGGAAYVRLVSDPDFWQAVRNTSILMAVGIPAQFLLGLGLALLLEQDFRFRPLVLVLLLFPMFAPPEVYTNSWKFFVLNPEFGYVGYWTTVSTQGQIGWLEEWAHYSVFIIDIWKWTPFVMLILLAGLVNIPKEVKELASLDRLSRWQRIRYVILPSMRPFVLVAFMFRVLTAIKEVEAPKEFTESAASPIVTTISVHIYNLIFAGHDITTAAAISVITLIFTVTTTFVFVFWVVKAGER